MTKGLLTSRQKKEKLYTKSCKNPTFTNKDNFKNFNKLYQKLCREAKILHYKNKLIDAGNNMKESWQVI